MTLVFFPRDAIEVLFENLFSPGESIAPDSTRALSLTVKLELWFYLSV
jgi:hypothetical protein